MFCMWHILLYALIGIQICLHHVSYSSPSRWDEKGVTSLRSGTLLGNSTIKFSAKLVSLSSWRAYDSPPCLEYSFYEVWIEGYYMLNGNQVTIARCLICHLPVQFRLQVARIVVFIALWSPQDCQALLIPHSFTIKMLSHVTLCPSSMMYRTTVDFSDWPFPVLSPTLLSISKPVYFVL